MKNLHLLFCIIFLPTLLCGQNISVIKKDTLVRSAKIEYSIDGNVLNVTPEVPVLYQIAGAPKPFYTYFWEFGDGSFSREKAPKHRYKKKSDYEVKLWVTNHYDNGKRPTTRPQKVSVNALSNSITAVASMEDSFMLQKNREPIPEEEMVVVMQYKNDKAYVTNGKLFLFYNEKKYKSANFEITDVRTHHNEKLVLDDETFVFSKQENDNAILYASLSTSFISNRQQDTTKTNLIETIKRAKDYYKNSHIFKFDDLNPSEERNIFFTLKTTPEMLKDTSAIISIRGVYVPDDNYKNHKVKEMEMEVVTSHDPNKMSSNGTIMNYRLVRYKTLKYKIRFQNNGEGPARTIRLETDIPEMLDKSTLKVVDMYPKVSICPKEKVSYSCLDTIFTKKQAIFTFKNIYLPGTNQKNVQEKDSTKGFVKYQIKFGEDFHKKKTKSRTAIIFDKNEPIITNQSTTRFLPGISVGAKAGYNYYPELENSKSYFVGATLSPYKSYRWYWQVELLNNLHTYNGGTMISEKVIERQGIKTLERLTSTKKYQNINMEIPVLVRYNINNYFGLGVGIQGAISVKEKQEETSLLEIFRVVDNVSELVTSEEKFTSQSSNFTNFRNGYIFEVTGGFSRIGPSLGARYIINSERTNDYWQFYAIWKF